ncbi:MAG: glutamate racemase [Nitrospinota bacterium]
MSDKSSGIGIFDSGVGGLTVLQSIKKRLPKETLIYFGDTARVPYGTKSAETVTKFARQDIHFLMSQGVKMIVAACNTASALALDTLKKEIDIPIIGVIEPGAKGAVAASLNKKIGVIGTEATINSDAYSLAIRRIDKNISVVSHACPLFVPMAEEGWGEHRIAKIAAEEYLSAMKGKVDTIVLGCTHYPLLKKTISKVVGKGVTLVDSAEETAKEVERCLAELNLLSDRTGASSFYVSDNPNRFKLVGDNFLGNGSIGRVDKIDIDTF